MIFQPIIRLSMTPTLPQEDITIPFEFQLMGSAEGVSTDITTAFSHIVLTPTTISYKKNSTNYVVYEEGSWLDPSLRILMVANIPSLEEEEEIFKGLLAKEQEDISEIEFNFMGQPLKAPMGINWRTWISSQAWQWLQEEEFFFLPSWSDTVLFQGILEVYLNDELVHITDQIVSQGEYHLIPSIHLIISGDDKVNINCSSVHNAIAGVVLTEGTYTFPIKTDPGYYLADVETTEKNEYVTYSLQDNLLSIIVKPLPALEEFTSTPTTEIVLPRAERRTFITLAQEEDQSISDSINTQVWSQPYRVEVEGLSYSGNYFSKITEAEVQGEEKPGVAIVVLPIIMFYCLNVLQLLLGQENREVFPYGLLFHRYPEAKDIALSERVLLMNDFILQYLGGKLKLEELIGEKVYIIDKEETLIISKALEALAKENNVTLEELQLEIESYAAEQEITIKEAQKLFIQELFDMPFETLYVEETVSIDEGLLSEIESLSKQIEFFPFSSFIDPFIGSASLSTRDSTNSDGEMFLQFLIGTGVGFIKPESGKKITRTSTVIDDKNYLLLNNGEVVDRTVVANGNNDFNFSGRQVGDYALSVKSFSSPKSRNSPGSVVVEITCLSGDTEIAMADGSLKRLDKIELGESVLTSNGVEKVLYTDKDLHKLEDKYIIYHFSNGKSLTVIKDHRVYSLDRKKFVKISKVKKGERIQTIDGPITLVCGEVRYEPINHYCIFTENYNDYYANGILCGSRLSNIKFEAARKLVSRFISWLCRKGGL